MNQNRNPNWWSRNWKWFVPTLCLLLLLAFCAFIGLIFFGVTSMMKSSDAYQMAVYETRNSPDVISKIGEPIVEGFFTTGSINTNGGSGSADMAIPISGPKGEATVYASATKSAGKWKFSDLVVEIENTQDRIDLLQEPESH